MRRKWCDCGFAAACVESQTGRHAMDAWFELFLMP